MAGWTVGPMATDTTPRPDPFPHLHVASAYSLRYGTAFPAALARRAAEHGADMLALTDRDGLYGAIKHVQACAEHGLAPIVGVPLPLLSYGGSATLTCLAAAGILMSVRADRRPVPALSLAAR